MVRCCNKLLLGVGFAILLFPGQLIWAQQAVNQGAAAPIPAQILTAKKVFVVNGGEDLTRLDPPPFSGGADRAYNELYAGLKKWEHYELVGAPADADLVIEVRFTEPPAPEQYTSETPLTERPDIDPQFQVSFRDPKTNVLLWAFTEHVEWALLQKNRDKNFDQAVGKIVGEIQAIATPQPQNSTN
jgi:hypothetical protein